MSLLPSTSAETQQTLYPSWYLDGRKLPEMPLEIYWEIIGHIKPPDPSSESEAKTKQRMRDLRSLSVVCRLLRTILFPLIFKSVLFLPDVPDDEEWQDESYTVIYKSLSHETHLPDDAIPHISRAVLRGDRSMPESNMRKALLNTYAQILPKMDHLSEISLTEIRLTSIVFHSLEAVPSLTSLTLDNCDWVAINAATIRKFALKVKLQKFRFSYWNPNHTELSFGLGSYSLESDVIEALGSLAPLLKEFSTDFWPVTHKLLSKKTPSLLSLHSVHVALSDFLRYLEEIPTLTSLSIHYFTGSTSSPFPLSRLPNLRQLTCPLSMLLCFTGPHTLSKLFFYTPPRLPESHSTLTSLKATPWTDLGQYTALTELCIPWWFALTITVSPGNGITQLEKLILYGSKPSSPEINIEREIFYGSESSDNGDESDPKVRQIFTTFATSSLKELSLIELMPNRIPVDPFIKDITANFFPSLDSFSNQFSNRCSIWRRVYQSEEWVQIDDDEY